MIEGEVIGRAGAGGVVDQDGTRAGPSKASTSEHREAHPGAYDPVARLALLDEVGIYAQIIFPGVVGLGGQKLAEVVRTSRCERSAPRSSTTSTPSSRPARATGSSPWPYFRPGTSKPASGRHAGPKASDYAGST